MAVGLIKTLSGPTVLLLGASNQIGVFLIPRLIRAGFNILAVSRNGKPEGYPDIEQLAWLTSIEVAQADERYEFLVSAGPMELAHQILITCRNIHTAVIFSSSSVITKKESAIPAERNQMQDMLRIESELSALATSHAFRLVILRPTMIYGCGLDNNISRLASWIRRFGFLPVNGKASGLRQPVHADDLADVAVTALQTDDPLPRDLVLAGGSTLGYVDMVTGIFAALGKPARILHLPQWLFMLLVRLRPGSDINSEMVRRQGDDLVFDDRPARELLAYKPRRFEPAERDFKLPEFE
jgi:nucleoside-diphosphate-sugar epimerase